MKKKWSLALGVVGLFIGTSHPGNTSFDVGIPEEIAFAIPWAALFLLSASQLISLPERNKAGRIGMHANS